jgi:site-specific recombinase XerD
VDDPLSRYDAWLSRQPLSPNTRRTYRTKIKAYLAFTAAGDHAHGDPLHDGHARDYAVRDFKTRLKMVQQVKPSTVNLALAALDHFYRFLEMGTPNVRRENLPQAAPASLSREAQINFLRAVERCTSVRDRAIALILYHTGVRVGECAALNRDDVLISARKGTAIVRSGKGDAYREVPLNAEARNAVQAWLDERAQRWPGSIEPALFLQRRGKRLSTRTMHDVVSGLGREAGLELSAHTLRHTCLTSLVRNGNDLVLVAELAGHRRIETTRRYSLPSAQDRHKAMEGLLIEY